MFRQEESTGTTIMAIKYNKGVIIGADSRTSMGTYVSGRITDKLTKLSDGIFCCRSGSSADTQLVAKYVKNSLRSLEILESTRPTVRRAAVMTRNIIYNNPSLLAGIIIAGYDEISGGSIFNINLGGSMFESEWALGGSGSSFIYGYCDMNWRPEMSLQEGLSFVKNAISCAIRRDNMSGGCIRMATISAEGVQRYFVPGNEIVAK